MDPLNERNQMILQMETTPVFDDEGMVDRAVSAAVAALPAWRRTSASERAGRLRQAAAEIRRDADELGLLLTRTTGRLLGESVASAAVAADALDEAAGFVLSGAGRVLPGSPDAVDEVRLEPRGVIAVITPWNDPYPAAAGLLAAALATGNVVVHKPSERSMAPGIALAERIARALPTGVLNVLEGGPEVGAALTRDPRLDVVAHIGSTATGRAIAEEAGRNGVRVVRENGGKDAVIVDSGVDPAWAAAQIATGAFTNAGQLCTSVERVYLLDDVHDRVVEELVTLAEGLRTGDPADPRTTLAPLVDERMLAVVDGHVQDALSQGAACLTGGRRVSGDSTAYAATVLTDCTMDMLVMREETFGPVAPIIRCRSFDEALELADASRYGLAATVLTNDMQHALRAADALDVGTVKINAVFGGAPAGSADPRRDSGSGTGYGPDLFREFTAVKAVHLEWPGSAE